MRLTTSLPREVLLMAMDSVLSHKFRSALTVLGIVVGIIMSRISAELILIVFRINENLGAIRDQGRDHDRGM